MPCNLLHQEELRLSESKAVSVGSRSGDECLSTLSALDGCFEAMHVLILSGVPCGVTLKHCKLCNVLLSLDKCLCPALEMQQRVG